jgi:hypothetical protein
LVDFIVSLARQHLNNIENKRQTKDIKSIKIKRTKSAALNTFQLIIIKHIIKNRHEKELSNIDAISNDFDKALQIKQAL